MRQRLVASLAVLAATGTAVAAEGVDPDHARDLLERYCYECHGFDDATREADLNIAFFADGDHWHSSPETLDDILWYVDPEGDGSMPPEDAPQPSAEERAALLAWAQQTLTAMRDADPDDPGVVPVGRLTHATYDRVIRDLTGAEISVAALLPRDSVGGEGFTSASANQMVTPELAEKWLEVAHQVLRHARVSPNRGLIWHDTTVPGVTDLASARAAYQGEWVNWHDEVESYWAGRIHGCLDDHQIPGVDELTPQNSSWEQRQAQRKRRSTAWYLIGAWRYRHREALGLGDATFADVALGMDPQLVPTGLERFWALLHREDGSNQVRRAMAAAWSELPGADAAGDVPALCDQIAERFAEDKDAGTRSGWPSMRRSRDDFSGNQYNPFIPVEGFDLTLLLPRDEIEHWRNQARSWEVDPYEINKLSGDLIRANARHHQEQWAAFQGLIADIRQAHDPDPAAEAPIAEDIILDVARRAWRGGLAEAEREGLLALYAEARAEGAAFESAVKRALAAVLVSPRFLYRLEDPGGGEEVYAVDQRDLAERLSFAIWGSIPDGELADLAMAGELDDDATLVAQVQRMLDDPRSIALGELFGAQYLQFADLVELAQPDPDRFGAFTDEVAASMFEESTRFIHHLFVDNRPLTDLVSADYTFANDPLAVFYGFIEHKGRGMRGDAWRRYDLPDQRSGLLTQGSILVLHSEPLRTSPVRRGAWLVSHLLGTPPPEPPADVPEISEDDVSPEGLSVREQLAQHRDRPDCRGCHEKIDPYGIALEHFDPAGRWREVDSAEQAIEAIAETADGTTIAGIEGLRAWLLQERQRDLMVRQFCRKLLGYCIGRQVRVTDGPLLDRMYQAMAADDWRVLPALEAVVTSRQFRYRRDETR